MHKDLYRKIVIEQHQMIAKRNIGVIREILEDIKKKISNFHIIVITGIRRCGKSTLLRQIMHEIYENKGYYYVNFDDERFLDFQANQFDELYEALLEQIGDYKVIFFDEIQNINGFEHFVRRLHDIGFKIFFYYGFQFFKIHCL